jgi:hypothetical protein
MGYNKKIAYLIPDRNISDELAKAENLKITAAENQKESNCDISDLRPHAY